MKLKRNDKVIVIKGKDRGKAGKILRVLGEENLVVVEGINLAKKTTRPNRRNPKGGVVEFPAPISASNVQLICSHCGKKTRIGYRLTKGGQRSVKDGSACLVGGQISGRRKERICRKCQTVL